MNIISMSVLPSRIEQTEQCIKSILAQNKKPDKIYVCIPKNPRRDKVKNYKLPYWFKHPSIEVVKTDVDYGPATKLLPVLRKYWEEKDTRIVTVDDDVYYPPNWFNTLIEYSDNNPDVVVCYRGRNFVNKTDPKYNQTFLFTSNKINHPRSVDVVTGTWGVLYKPSFFTEDVFGLDLSSKAFFVDDIWFTGNLWKNGVKRLIIPLKQEIKPLEQHNTLALWNINQRGENNDWTIGLFKQYLK